MTSKSFTIMLVAVEASGDDRGGGLMRALRRRFGDQVRFVGVGGARMAAEGLNSPFSIAELSIFGILEGVLAAPRVIRRAREVAAMARQEAPAIAILIDSWGFNLEVAKRLRADLPAMPLVKYVAPQVWASRPGRARTAARWFDHLLAIHSFDIPAFEKEGLAVTCVGDATLSMDFTDADPQGFRQRIAAGPDDPILLVLPGSRPSEIRHILPSFADAAGRLARARPELKVIVLAAPTVADTVKTETVAWPFSVHVLEGEVNKRDAMKAATVALACSGTVTTELAMAGCPMVVGYRLSAVTYAILKRMIRTRYVTLFNIAAQDFIAPELIQDACTGEALAREVGLRLDDTVRRVDQVRRQSEALQQMGRGGPDPSEAAAAVVSDILSLAPQRLSTDT